MTSSNSLLPFATHVRFQRIMENKKPWPYLTAAFPRVYTEKSLLYLIATKRRDFLEITKDKSLLYKLDKQAKKSGGFRDIYKPAWKLKSLLRKINSRLLSRLNYPNFVHCGPDGRSITTAARGHTRFTYHLALDVTAFFDQVSETVTQDTLRKIGLNKELTNTIVVAAVENNRLPQGFPTSSLLSALVISYVLQDFYIEFDREKVLLSVYADDLLVSSDDESAVWAAKNYIEERIGTIGLKLNSKEQFAKNGQKFTWVGLQIYPWITIPREELRRLEKQVYEYKTTGSIPADYVPKKPLKKGKTIEDAWQETMKGKAVFARSISHNRLPEKSLVRLASSRKK